MSAQVISFHCVLRNRLGKLISSTFNNEVITFAEGQGDMLRGLVEGLKDLKTGERRRIFLPAEEAYGFYDPQKVIEISREELPKRRLKKGDKVVADSDDGHTMTYRVVESNPEVVVLDANHPLAGQDLVFEIEALSAREATDDEIRESEEPVTAEELVH